jgi:hypothetical protein
MKRLTIVAGNPGRQFRYTAYADRDSRYLRAREGVSFDSERAIELEAQTLFCAQFETRYSS